MSDLYILDGETPVPEPDILRWGRWMQRARTNEERQVAATTLNDGVFISTVFLGIDHSFGFRDRPILFETMIFGGPYDQDQWRYETWAQADAGHTRIVQAIIEGRDPNAPIDVDVETS